MKRSAQLGPHDAVKAHEWLVKHCKVVERDEEGHPKLCRYAEGASDELLSTHLDSTIDQAKYMRKRLFGELIQVRSVLVPASDEKTALLFPRIEALEALVRDLQRRLFDVENAMTKPTPAATAIGRTTPTPWDLQQNRNAQRHR